MIYDFNRLGNEWNKTQDLDNGGVDWNLLEPEKQTVLLSVFRQYGSTRRFPKFWTKATSGNWNAAIDELRNFNDDYATRRDKEADLLESIDALA